MARWLYSLLAWLVQPLLRRKLMRRGRQEPGYLVAVEERFGQYAMPALPDDGRTLWVHAVSLGETRAAAVLLATLRAQWPAYRLLLTHGTATGRAEGVGLLREGDVQVWLPWDTSTAVQSFLDHFHPRLGILLETEVWPNLAAGCERAGVPLVLANARLSEKSLRKAQRLAWLSVPVYRSLAAVWAQTQDDATRLAAIGAPVQGVFGNLKFDATPDAGQMARGQAWRTALGRPVVMFASSREGEEAELLQCLRQAGEAARAIQWLIVPRHPQRFDEVAELITRHGFSLARRSQWGSAPGLVEMSTDVWLGDTLGEMALYYGLSDAALLGGSFAPLGGQNLIEAAACACPVFMGPHTFNFDEAASLAQEAGAAQRCSDLAAAVAAAQQLVQQPLRQQAMAREASRFAKAHRGAALRTREALAVYLG
ncbi:MAG: 3-deoxy-D-manno-octulosonic acid transferase [Burkholderiales bacterium]|nr:3-deoxy-D-manno-octulosonic acid transferase [Burkholderiales bacterium]